MTDRKNLACSLTDAIVARYKQINIAVTVVWTLLSNGTGIHFFYAQTVFGRAWRGDRRLTLEILAICLLCLFMFMVSEKLVSNTVNDFLVWTECIRAAEKRRDKAKEPGHAEKENDLAERFYEAVLKDGEQNHDVWAIKMLLGAGGIILSFAMHIVLNAAAIR